MKRGKVVKLRLKGGAREKVIFLAELSKNNFLNLRDKNLIKFQWVYV